MAPTDKRKIVGEKVYAKAKHVTSDAECSRLFGARAKQKELPGKVIEVNEFRTRNNRSSTSITADYVFPNGRIKRKTLNIRSVLKSVSNQLDEVVISPVSPPPNSTSTETKTETVNATAQSVTAEVINDVGNRWTADDFQAVARTRTTNNAADDADSSSTNMDESDVVATVNGTKWRLDDRATKLPINGIVPERDFAIKTPVGDTLARNSGDFGLSCLDFFC